MTIDTVLEKFLSRRNDFIREVSVLEKCSYLRDVCIREISSFFIYYICVREMSALKSVRIIEISVLERCLY